MKFFDRLVRQQKKDANLTTALERQRLGKTMPGQTGALAAARFGYLIN